MNNDRLIEAMARAMWDQRWKDLQSSPIRELMGANTREWECKEPDVQEEFRQQARAALAALQEHTGWIPVSERLPPECVDVLVMRDYGQIVGNPAHRDYGKRYHYKITRRYGNEFLSDLMETGQVTHWMPLPPAPQTEEPRGINVSGHTYVRRSATSYVCRRCGHDMCREEPKPCANQQPEEAS